MAQGVIDKFTGMMSSLENTNDPSHNSNGTVNNPGFLLGAGIHFDAGLDLVVVSADGSLDIGFAARLEHFDPSEVPATCSTNGTIGFNNWYAMAIFYANLSADLSVGPFTVGSVNAGAVLAAGLVSPTWASGDIYIDVSALGVIDFSGSVSISIGNPCSIVKDPLDHIDMIGDFGPRTKDGSPVDVTSSPYVVGNVPLNTNYPVMVNNGDMRDYLFKIDAYDVTTSTGQPLGGTSQKQKNEYEVDIDHNEMLCGNSSYNAHIRCSAYQTNGATPATPLVSQDTTFSFTTGPRPQTIQLNNLIYSYPVAGQRFLLKNEFGSQGNLVVSQDVGYLLSPGSKDDCSTTPPPNTGSGSSGAAGTTPANPAGVGPTRVNELKKVSMAAPSAGMANMIVTTQLLAKFYPIGGGDTLKTPFSYTYNQNVSTGTPQFPLPATLQNNKAYALEIWVIPPPPSKSDATIAATSNNKNLSQSETVYTTTYKTNANGNVVPVLVASQVNSTATQTNTTRSLNGTRQMAATDSARIIFSMSFATSKYNTFTDKMAAYGNWGAADETSYQFDMPIFSNAPDAEPFDVFEIKDFQSSCTVNGFTNPTIARMFDADVPWDPNAHNDQDAGLIYVYASGINTLTHAAVDLGVPDIRGWFGVPTDSLMSMENMPYQSKIGAINNSYMGKLNSGALQASANSNTQPTATNKLNGAFTLTTINNSSYQLPGSNGGGVKMVAYGASYNYSNGGQPSNTVAKAPPGLLWKRDDYFYNDYMLLKDFVSDLSTKNNTISGQAITDLLRACPGCIVEQASGYYGSISMTAAGWGSLMGSDMTLFWQDVNQFLSLPFTPFPPTARRGLHFAYRYPSPSYTRAPAEATATFSYKSMLLPQFTAVKATNSSSNFKVAPASNGNPAAGTGKVNITMPIQSSTVKELLSKKYNIR